jgi:hypothetical protein
MSDISDDETSSNADAAFYCVDCGRFNGTKIILISAYDLDSSLVKELEENKYIVKYIEKPIRYPI